MQFLALFELSVQPPIMGGGNEHLPLTFPHPATSVGLGVSVNVSVHLEQWFDSCSTF